MNSPHEEHRFPCEQCGADLRFSPETGVLTCDHCGFTETAENPTSPEILELDFQDALSNSLSEEQLEERRVTNCTNCGAQITFDEQVHADECPFCATPVVTDTGLHRVIKPKAVLPFAIPESEAHDHMEKWLGRLWFAPNGLAAYARKGRKMQGVYIPYWTYDAQTKTRYTGGRGTEYTTTKTVVIDGKRQKRTVVKVRWVSVSGRVSRFFDDVLVMASHSLPKGYSDGLHPWDLSSLETYQPRFLAGFMSEGYSVGLDEGFIIAKDVMANRIRRDIRFDIGGDRQRIDRAETQYSDITFKHILAPIWMAAYKYRGKSYRFVVNGQTGKVQGERPYSIWKILFAVLLAVIALAAGMYFTQ
ncbi:MULTISPECIES: TFIIB-type zinc finger domain-containing protein [Halocynthiibacter]|uniref:TFIIB-type zinc finger domain-containing protein n=1 Tax=Halocynthiibacter halioticoli TaxID=2986804 RepID=A0AAE3LTJ9_9RHOB|nr:MULTISPECIES: TFIIB-type zinc finger domain-containing protein [Halocynthiibacter]MCV6825236.1 TFIIB-type zinc finger domain-containing protein [Halocynthiibacter halioticoli]MCW4058237.1 TFIIB-type zinc finger domain-containing protein [Halocynthiibacter sp. SDUM655004]